MRSRGTASVAFASLLGVMLITPPTALGQISQPTNAGAAARTERQEAWLSASLQGRVKIAEAIGEEGARELARAKGYERLCDGLGKVLSQGPDQVYRASDGRIVVIEAKGGSGQLGHAYGFPR